MCLFVVTFIRYYNISWQAPLNFDSFRDYTWGGPEVQFWRAMDPETGNVSICRLHYCHGHTNDHFDDHHHRDHCHNNGILIVMIFTFQEQPENHLLSQVCEVYWEPVPEHAQMCHHPPRHTFSHCCDRSATSFRKEIFSCFFLNYTNCNKQNFLVCTLFVPLGSMDLSLSGKVGLRAIVYYMATTVLAVILGIILVSSIRYKYI